MIRIQLIVSHCDTNTDVSVIPIRIPGETAVSIPFNTSTAASGASQMTTESGKRTTTYLTKTKIRAASGASQMTTESGKRTNTLQRLRQRPGQPQEQVK